MALFSTNILHFTRLYLYKPYFGKKEKVILNTTRMKQRANCLQEINQNNFNVFFFFLLDRKEMLKPSE